MWASSKESAEGILKQRKESSSSSDHFQPHFPPCQRTVREGSEKKKILEGSQWLRRLGRFILGGQTEKGRGDESPNAFFILTPLCIWFRKTQREQLQNRGSKSKTWHFYCIVLLAFRACQAEHLSSSTHLVRASVWHPTEMLNGKNCEDKNQTPGVSCRASSSMRLHLSTVML